MSKWRNVLVAMTLCVGLLLVAGAAISEPYWQIDEYSGPWSSDPDGTEIYFGVDNQHETDALAGFAVTVDPALEEEIVAMGCHPNWRVTIVGDAYHWGLNSHSDMTTSTDWQVKRSAEWFFGGTWDELFGAVETRVIMFWSKQNVSPPDSIPAGERWEHAYESHDSPLFWYAYGVEASTAAIRMQSGYTAHGEVNTPHGFPAGGPVIPEPATITLLGLGLIGAALRRRRK